MIRLRVGKHECDKRYVQISLGSARIPASAGKKVILSLKAEC